MNQHTADLALRARHGDRDAFDSLIARFRPRLDRAVSARLGPELREKLEVDDIVQETILKALGSIDSFEWRGEESFLRWLTGIAEYTLRDEVDRQRVRRTKDLPDELPHDDASPSTAVRREERFDRLEKALAKLPEEYRELIVLARVDGLPIQEIATRLDMTPNAVSQRLWRALRKLRERFGDTESFHLPERRLGETRNGDE